MPERLSAHTDRRRAGAFGSAAKQYDLYRPRYPRSLIADLVARRGICALDVGAGTGIASEQLVEAGAEIVAVEPDPRMARIAAGKGIRVEQATFEDWRPAGRSFDLVVFAQSFHWVQPQAALNKVATILGPGGRLGLLWNRITPMAPTRQVLDEAYVGYLDASQLPAIVSADDDRVSTIIDECGFTIERRHVIEPLHYSTDDWVNMVLTYSNVLTLDPKARAELRSQLEQRIGTAGVDAQNDAFALICTPHSFAAVE
jgi:ubiquinone/menaquinone biosynthesis C-methylase UbiE